MRTSPSRRTGAIGSEFEDREFSADLARLGDPHLARGRFRKRWTRCRTVEFHAFENAGQAANRPLAVILRGEPGNLAAVGSRVSVTDTSGRRQTAEVYAGGGYLSQSTSTLFFGLGETHLGEEIEIEVRWPSGEVTQHRKKVDGPYLEIGYEEPTL